MGTAEEFYGSVLQNLRAWKPTPPKLKKPAPESEQVLATAEATGAPGGAPAEVADVAAASDGGAAA